MQTSQIHSSAELMDLIDEIGFLPLLDSGIYGFYNVDKPVSDV